MNRSLLSTYALLAAPCLVVTSSALADKAEKSDAKLNFYGKVATGLLQHQHAKYDIKDISSTICNNIAGDCAPAKDQSYVEVTDGYFQTTKFGVNYQLTDAIKGTFELKVGLTGAHPDLYPRMYHFEVDLGVGSLTVGRQERPFYQVATTARRLNFAAEKVAGFLAEKHANGVVYGTGDLLGPASVQLGLINASNPGPKSAGASEAPAMEVAFNVKTPGVKAGLAFASEKKAAGAGAAALTADDPAAAGAAGAAGDPVTLSMVSAMAELDFAPLSAAIVYSVGDPLFNTGVTRNASFGKDAADKMTGLNLWISAKFAHLTTGVFYGMETADLSQKNGALTLAGENKDVQEQASTVGVHVSYEWKNAQWILEYSTTSRTYDSKTTNSDSYIGLGVATGFSA